MKKYKNKIIHENVSNGFMSVLNNLVVLNNKFWLDNRLRTYLL